MRYTRSEGISEGFRRHFYRYQMVSVSFRGVLRDFGGYERRYRGFQGIFGGIPADVEALHITSGMSQRISGALREV